MRPPRQAPTWQVSPTSQQARPTPCTCLAAALLLRARQESTSRAKVARHRYLPRYRRGHDTSRYSYHRHPLATRQTPSHSRRARRSRRATLEPLPQNLRRHRVTLGRPSILLKKARATSPRTCPRLTTTTRSPIRMISQPTKARPTTLSRTAHVEGKNEGSVLASTTAGRDIPFGTVTYHLHHRHGQN